MYTIDSSISAAHEHKKNLDKKLELLIYNHLLCIDGLIEGMPLQLSRFWLIVPDMCSTPEVTLTRAELDKVRILTHSRFHDGTRLFFISSNKYQPISKRQSFSAWHPIGDHRTHYSGSYGGMVSIFSDP